MSQSTVTSDIPDYCSTWSSHSKEQTSTKFTTKTIKLHTEETRQFTCFRYYLLNVTSQYPICNNLSWYQPHLLENGMSETTVILFFCRSMDRSLPKLLVLPPTFTLSWRNCSWKMEYILPLREGGPKQRKAIRQGRSLTTSLKNNFLQS